MAKFQTGARRVADVHGKVSCCSVDLPFAKLEWLNGVYIRDMDPAELQERLLPYLSEGLGIPGGTLRNDPRLPLLVPLIQERLKRLTEAAEKMEWAFQTADEIDYSNP